MSSVNPWDEDYKKEIPEEKEEQIPEKPKEKHIKLSKTLMGKLVDRLHERVETCPLMIYHQHIADERIPMIITDAMRYGMYGEQVLLGRGARDEVVEISPLKNGQKSKDQIRIEDQMNIFVPKNLMEYQISILKNANVQVPITMHYQNNIYLQGVIDVFPTPVIWNGEWKLALLDVKVTGDVNSEFGSYCWGKPEWIDHLQPDLYQYILGSNFDIELNKKMNKHFEVAVGYDNIFTDFVMERIRARDFIFLYVVVGYKKDDLKSQFKIIERKFWNAGPDYHIRTRELQERIRKSLLILREMSDSGWKPNPLYSRCKNCSVSKYNGGPCNEAQRTQSI